MLGTATPLLALALVVIGLFVAPADDKPGVPVLATLVMTAGIVIGVRSVRHRVDGWAARALIVAGVALAAATTFVIHGHVVARPLFAQAEAIPSASGPAVAPHHRAAVDRARALVHTAILEENLPGVSVAVGLGDTVVWAEGFGWRDIPTQAHVTPTTRFHIGSAAPVVAPSVAPLGLSHTGTDTAADWSPEHVGEPEEDFPGFTLLRHVLWEPLGLMPPLAPLAGERATYYVPRADNDPRRGRDPMRMRDLACCAEGKAFSSTPIDLVRVALASHPGSVDGHLAGGTVMSLVDADGRVVVAVTSNIAHAHTHDLAQRIAEAFAAPSR